MHLSATTTFLATVTIHLTETSISHFSKLTSFEISDEIVCEGKNYDINSVSLELLSSKNAIFQFFINIGLWCYQFCKFEL